MPKEVTPGSCSLSAISVGSYVEPSVRPVSISCFSALHTVV